MSSYQETIATVTDAALERWPIGVPFSLLHAARALTLEVIMRVVFGISDAAELQRVGRTFEDLLAYGASEQIVFRYLTRRLGTGSQWRGLNAATAAVHQVLQELIDRRRAEPESGTLLLAGHETTATTLAWIFDYLTHRPDVAVRLTQEAKAGEDHTYVDAVINEALRLRPRSWVQLASPPRLLLLADGCFPGDLDNRLHPRASTTMRKPILSPPSFGPNDFSAPRTALGTRVSYRLGGSAIAPPTSVRFRHGSCEPTSSSCPRSLSVVRTTGAQTRLS